MSDDGASLLLRAAAAYSVELVESEREARNWMDQRIAECRAFAFRRFAEWEAEPPAFLESDRPGGGYVYARIGPSVAIRFGPSEAMLVRICPHCGVRVDCEGFGFRKLVDLADLGYSLSLMDGCPSCKQPYPKDADE